MMDPHEVLEDADERLQVFAKLWEDKADEYHNLEEYYNAADARELSAKANEISNSITKLMHKMERLKELESTLNKLYKRVRV